MNKKIFKTLLLSGLITSSHLAQSNDAFTGPYVGVGLGYIHDETTFKATSSEPGQLPAEGVFFRGSRYNALSGSVNGGYGHTFSHGIYTAAELKVSHYNNYDPKGSGGEKITYKYGYHLTVKAGKVFNDNFVVYLKGGYVNTKMNYRYDQGQTVLAKKDSAMRGGYEYGLGFGYKVTDCFVLGLEASRTNYKKYSFTQGPRANDDNDGYTKHYTHNPRLEQVELKFTYQF